MFICLLKEIFITHVLNDLYKSIEFYADVKEAIDKPTFLYKNCTKYDKYVFIPFKACTKSPGVQERWAEELSESRPLSMNYDTRDNN